MDGMHSNAEDHVGGKGFKDLGNTAVQMGAAASAFCSMQACSAVLA